MQHAPLRLPVARALLLPVLALLAAPLAADTLVTRDGRVLEVVKAREDPAGYRLTFQAGEIVVGKEHVASVEIEGDMSDYVPKDDKERDFLAQGYVRHKGKWISKPQYETELAKVAAARKKRTDELRMRSDFANGWVVETKHFKFRSNTSPEILQRYIDLIEGYYSLMDTRIGIKPPPTLARAKLEINVFKRQEEMIDHASDEDVDDSVLGFFDPVTKSLNFFHDYKDPARSEQTALHECTHLLTFLIDPDYLAEIWINEATAEYYGSCEVASDAKGKLTLTPGRVLEDAVLTVQQAIEAKEHVALKKLLLTQRDEFDGVHYAHAWSFVHFLQNTAKYSKNFNKFFKDLYGLDLKEAKAELLDAGDDDKSGLRRRYKADDILSTLLVRLGTKDIAVLETEWLAYVAAVRIDAPRARFLRGYETALSGGDPKKALADLDAAIEGGYRDAQAYWARGYARLFSANQPAALEDFRRAVEIDPVDPVYRADLAWGLVAWWGAESEGMLGTEEERDEAQKQFGLAAELDPDNDYMRTLFDEFVAARAKK